MARAKLLAGDSMVSAAYTPTVGVEANSANSA
jgi:hypothetical protein